MSEPVYKVGDPAPPPLPRRSEAEVMARWQGDEPVVSILCPTYQHVGFIEDALRGFLGQDTDFPFEVLVRDDASTDGTAEIVRDYAERYPNIIRAVFETENRYPKIKPLQALIPMARRQFIAFCEGDDYWIDPSYLERRAAILCEDTRAVAVVGRSWTTQDGLVRGYETVKPTGEWNWYLPVRSLLVRTDLDFSRFGRWDDMAIALTVQKAGPLRVIEEKPSAVYRQHAGGVYSGLLIGGTTLKANRPSLIESHAAIALQLAQEGDLALAKQYHQQAIKYLGPLLEGFETNEKKRPSLRQRFRWLSKAVRP